MKGKINYGLIYLAAAISLLVLSSMAFASGQSVRTEKVAVVNWYQVKKDDNLYRISLKFGVSVASILEANPGKIKKVSLIHPGQSLKIVSYKIVPRETKSIESGKSASVAQKEPESPEKKSQARPEYHVVKRGENLGKISIQYGISILQLRSWNGLRNTVIHPEQRLLVTAPPRPAIYVVRYGDTLSGICEKYDVHMEQIIGFNKKWLSRKTILRPGDNIRLRERMYVHKALQRARGLKGSDKNRRIARNADLIAFAMEDAYNRTGFDYEFCLAVAKIESDFDPEAVSPKGAKGIAQFMEKTGLEYGVTNRFDVVQSINGLFEHLHDLYIKYNGDLRLVLAAYNAGSYAVEKYGGVPPYEETEKHIEKVLACYSKYKTEGGDVITI